jgi:hypothetical protein
MKHCLLSIILCIAAIDRVALGQALDDSAEGALAPKAPPIKFKVLQSKRIDQGGRSLFLNEVAPPLLPPVPATVASAANAGAVELTPEEVRTAAKKQELLSLSATVYDRQVTEVHLAAGDRDITIFTNIDFNLLAGQSSFETDDTLYTMLIGLGNETREHVEAIVPGATQPGGLENTVKTIPTPDSFSQIRSEYIVAEGAESGQLPDGVLQALDALHSFYDANKQRLADEYARREIERVEQEQWLKEHPPVPKNAVINYWFGKGATTTLDKRSLGGAK